MNFNFINLNSVDKIEITKGAFANHFNTDNIGTIKWIVTMKLLLLNIRNNIDNSEKIKEILQNFYDVQYNENIKEELYNSYIHEKENKIHDLIKKYKSGDSKNALEILNDIDNEINKTTDELKYKSLSEEVYHTNMHVEEIYIRLLILAIYNNDNVNDMLKSIFKIMTDTNNIENNNTVYSLIPFNTKYLNSEILYIYANPYWLKQIEFNLNMNNVDDNIKNDLNTLKDFLEKNKFDEIIELRSKFEHNYSSDFSRDNNKTKTIFRCLGSLDAIKDLESGLLAKEFEIFNNFINDKTKTTKELDNLISKVSQKIKYIFNMMTIGTIYVKNIHNATKEIFDIRIKAIEEFLNNGYTISNEMSEKYLPSDKNNNFIKDNNTVINIMNSTQEIFEKLCLIKYFEKNLEKKETKDNKDL